MEFLKLCLRIELGKGPRQCVMEQGKRIREEKAEWSLLLPCCSSVPVDPAVFCRSDFPYSQMGVICNV